MKKLSYTLAAALVAAVGVLPATHANAQTANAAGRDLSVHINLLGIAQLDVDAQAPSVLVDVTVATDISNSLPQLDLGDTLLHLTTGLLTSNAQYVTGGTAAAGATTTVTSLDLSAVSILSNPLLAVSADAITSSSIVSGYCLPAKAASDGTDGLLDDFVFGSDFDPGNLRSGPPGGDPTDNGATLGGLTISILGIDVPNLPLNPPPNTGIDLSGLGILGATLVLNEQTMGGDGVTSIAKTSNAVHLSLNVASLVTADVVIGHSEASLDCSN